MATRQREVQLKFRASPEERTLIETKMAQLGTTNMAAYLRKMALDGYVVNLELPELQEMVSLLRRSSNKELAKNNLCISTGMDIPYNSSHRETNLLPC